MFEVYDGVITGYTNTGVTSQPLAIPQALDSVTTRDELNLANTDRE